MNEFVAKNIIPLLSDNILVPIVAAIGVALSARIAIYLYTKDKRIIAIREKQLDIYTSLYRKLKSYIKEGTTNTRDFRFVNIILNYKIQRNYNYISPRLIRMNETLEADLHGNKDRHAKKITKAILKDIKREYFSLLKYLSYSTENPVKNFFRMSFSSKVFYCSFVLYILSAILIYVFYALATVYESNTVYPVALIYSILVFLVTFLITGVMILFNRKNALV
ncbi:MAG TPA: hypothetical protein VHQ24_04805 [Lachnospiraceae bacterium]|nr:hypothetical protein [Lachnospiraceae bacterium]